MSAPSASAHAFLDLLRRSEVVRPDALAAALDDLGEVPADPGQCAAALIRAGLITKFQAKLLLSGRFRGFKVGPYVILEQIGQGGMGAVFLAEHETLHRKVAVKVLTTGFGNKLAVERFLREARSAAALDHPNIVRIFDVFKASDNHYLVMEYVEGDTLEQVVSRGEPIACGRAATYVSQAAAGLQHAYEKGFIHRDIKPANLMLTKDGTVKILDMGLARQTNGTNDKLTEVMDQGAIVGTADFISPEQAMNAPQIDIRADIYSLGATFFALVVGKPPFEGNTTQKLIQHQLKEAASLVSLDRTFPPGLAAVIATMLRKKPEDRFQTPSEVIAALAPWLPNSGQAAKVLAGLSSSDLNSSAQLQNTLNEVMSGGTKRMTMAGMRAPGRGPKLPPAVIGIAAALVAVVAIGGIYLGFGGAKNSDVIIPPEVLANPAPNARNQATPGSVTPAVAQVNTKAKAFVPGASRSGYRLSLAGLKPFTVSGTGATTGIPARDIRLAETGRTGTGDFPAGWNGTPFGRAEAEYTAAEVDGRMALGMRYKALNGDGKAMLLAPDLPVPPGPCRVKLEYKTALPASDALIVRFKATGPGAVTTFDVSDKYPGSPDEWKTVEFDANLKGAGTGFFEIHLDDTAPGQTLWVRAFEFGNPSAGGKSLYTVDFTTTATGTETVSRQYTGGDLGGRKLPDGVQINHYEANATGTYSVADVFGGRALGLRQVSGNQGAQVQFQCNGMLGRLAPGEPVVVRLTYAADGGGAGFVAVQLGESPWTKHGQTLLPSTGGKWTTVEVPFTRPTEGNVYEVIVAAKQNGGDGAEVWVKDVQVLGPGAPEPAVAGRFTPLPLAAVGTATTARSLFMDSQTERLTFPGYGRQELVGVPFDLLDPQGGAVKNAILLRGLDGPQPLAAPDLVTVPVNRRATAIHFLGGVGGWAWPWAPRGAPPDTDKGKVVLTVRLKYADGLVEEFPWRNGEQVADWIKRTDVPGSEFAFSDEAGHQVRYLTVRPSRDAEVRELEFVKGEVSATAPLVLAITVEGPASPAAATATARPAAPPTPTTPTGKALAFVDFSGVTDFRAQYADGKFADAIPPFPPGMSGQCWKRESAAEFRGGKTDGPALGLTNLNESLSAQLMVQLEDALGAILKPGGAYTVWVEYKTTNEAAGEVLVRTPDYNPVGKTPLAGTNGQWRWAAVTFRRSADAKLHAVIENTAIGEGNTVWVRKIEVRE